MAIYALRLLAERALGLLLFLLGSSWRLGPCATLWFVAYFGAAVCGAGLYVLNADLMDRRADIASTKDVTPVWDKVILALFWLLAYFVIYYVAGISIPTSTPIGSAAIIGVVIYAASTALTFWALRTNAYAESVSRVQSERGQTVCDAGPYAHVRHPMYSAILMWCVAVVLVFPSPAVACVSFAVLVLIVVRTLLEDEMLARGLAGYKSYRTRVPWRLVPRVF